MKKIDRIRFFISRIPKLLFEIISYLFITSALISVFLMFAGKMDTDTNSYVAVIMFTLIAIYFKEQ